MKKTLPHLWFQLFLVALLQFHPGTGHGRRLLGVSPGGKNARGTQSSLAFFGTTQGEAALATSDGFWDANLVGGVSTPIENDFLGIQSPSENSQLMIGVSPLTFQNVVVFRFHDHSQKVIGSLGWCTVDGRNPAPPGMFIKHYE